jgi:SAM-dependent methyltransferase
LRIRSSTTYQATRKYLPAALRRFARITTQELPLRLHDFREDGKDLFRPADARLPPARLRRRVSQTSDREEFSRVGEAAAANIALAFDRSRDRGRPYPRWLDFGCGPGRVARHLLRSPAVRELSGLDVDEPAIRWAASHLRPARFQAIRPDPPTGLPSGSFDVVFSVSVFTHLSEEAQRAWLAHLADLLVPGGLLIASTHSPELTYTLPSLSPAELETLEREGFLFASAGAAFNEDAAFHSLDYLDRVWTAWYSRVDFVPYGLGRHQDLGVWRKR